ncbi:MAG: hypothetical protein HPY69_06400 [Armatimonadetes bacterium]|nr:hypothetical protein [Armatimonadota bacterium]
MATEPGAEWTVVWEQAGPGADLNADLAVSLLQGSDIPVMRIPPSTGPVLFDGASGPLLPVRLLVPPEYEAEARELLQET